MYLFVSVERRDAEACSVVEQAPRADLRPGRLSEGHREPLGRRRRPAGRALPDRRTKEPGQSPIPKHADSRQFTL